MKHVKKREKNFFFQIIEKTVIFLTMFNLISKLLKIFKFKIAKCDNFFLKMVTLSVTETCAVCLATFQSLSGDSFSHRDLFSLSSDFSALDGDSFSHRDLCGLTSDFSVTKRWLFQSQRLIQSI